MSLKTLADPEQDVKFWIQLLNHHERRMEDLNHDPNGYKYHEKEAEKARIMIERLKNRSA